MGGNAYRWQMLVSGLAGLVCGALLFALASWLQTRFVPILPHGLATLMAWVLCFSISAAEIPVMVFGLRKLTADSGRRSFNLLLLINVFYVFFAAVYATVFVLLTGRVLPGAALGALMGLRLVSSLLFVTPVAAHSHRANGRIDSENTRGGDRSRHESSERY